MSSKELLRRKRTRPKNMLCRKCGAWHGCLGLEPTLELYVEHIVEMFDGLWRVLRDDGTFWLVIGDCYGERGLRGVPWSIASALQARGWYIRSEIIWHKLNGTPESVKDRPSKFHETVFLLTKRSSGYYFDVEAIREPAVSIDDPRKGNRREYNGKFDTFVDVPEDGKRNCRTVWPIAVEPFAGDHLAPFPKALPLPMVRAGTSEWGCCSKCGAPWKRGSASCSCDAPPVPCTVLDCCAGSGTTGLVANALGRKAVLIDANPEYCAMAKERIERELPEYKAKCAREDAWGNPITEQAEALEAAE